MDPAKMVFKINKFPEKISGGYPTFVNTHNLHPSDFLYNEVDVRRLVFSYPGEDLTKRHWGELEIAEREQKWNAFFQKWLSQTGEDGLRKLLMIDIISILENPTLVEFSGVNKSDRDGIKDTLVHFTNLLREFYENRRLDFNPKKVLNERAEIPPTTIY